MTNSVVARVRREAPGCEQEPGPALWECWSLSLTAARNRSRDTVAAVSHAAGAAIGQASTWQVVSAKGRSGRTRPPAGEQQTDKLRPQGAFGPERR